MELLIYSQFVMSIFFRLSFILCVVACCRAKPFFLLEMLSGYFIRNLSLRSNLIYNFITLRFDIWPFHICTKSRIHDKKKHSLIQICISLTKKLLCGHICIEICFGCRVSFKCVMTLIELSMILLEIYRQKLVTLPRLNHLWFNR